MHNPLPEALSSAFDQLDRQRRMRLLRLLALGLGGLVGLSIIMLIFTPSLSLLLAQMIALAAAGLAYWLAERQLVLGTFILVGGLSLSVAVPLVTSDTSADLVSVLPFLVVHVLVVGMLIGSRLMWATAGLALLVIGITYTMSPGIASIDDFLGIATLVVAVGGLTWLFIKGVNDVQSLLQERNAELERMVFERGQLMDELTAQAQNAEAQRLDALRLFEDLQDSQQTATLLQSTVQQLTTPALLVAPQVLAVPLIGTFDRERALNLQQVVLENIERLQAHTVILDATGLSHMDTSVARSLLETTQAAQLLGARSILAGVQPAVAETLVQLGIRLPDLHPTADLQSALALALRQS